MIYKLPSQRLEELHIPPRTPPALAATLELVLLDVGVAADGIPDEPAGFGRPLALLPYTPAVLAEEKGLLEREAGEPGMPVPPPAVGVPGLPVPEPPPLDAVEGLLGASEELRDRLPARAPEESLCIL